MEIETLKRMRLRDNDIIVFKHPMKLSEAAVYNILEPLKKILSSIPQKNVRAFILEEGMDIEVLGREDT